MHGFYSLKLSSANLKAASYFHLLASISFMDLRSIGLNAFAPKSQAEIHPP